jgi:NitT/TauT family transport system substrate-binding protein
MLRGDIMSNAALRWALAVILVVVAFPIKDGGNPVYAGTQPRVGTGGVLRQVVSRAGAIRLGVQPDLTDPSVFVAEDQGAPTDAGLALEVRRLGWGEIMDSLAAGGLDVGLMNPVAHLSARALGHDLRIVAAGSGEQATLPTRRLVVPGGSTMHTASDLANRWVGVAALGSPDHLMLQTWLGSQGIDPASVHFAELPAPLLVSALLAGRLDAALLAEPYLSTTVERGARALDSPYSDLTKESTPLNYFVAEGSWLSSHSDVARRFARVIHRVHADLQANPTAYRAAMVGHLGLDQALVDRMALPRLETHVSLSQVQTWADLLPPRPTATAPGAATLPLVASNILFDTVR